MNKDIFRGYDIENNSFYYSDEDHETNEGMVVWGIDSDGVYFETQEVFFSDSGIEQRRYVKPPQKVDRYIGLKEKGEQYVFEGDIVRILYTDWGSKSEDDIRTLEQYLIDIADIGEVVFKDCEYQIKFLSSRVDSHYYDTIHCGAHGYIETIGTVHEDRHLLLEVKI